MLQLTRRGFIVLGAAFGLSGCGEYIPTTVTPAVAATPAEMVDAINAVRKQTGSKPLAYSPALAGVAAGQARALDATISYRKILAPARICATGRHWSAITDRSARTSRPDRPRSRRPSRPG